MTRIQESFRGAHAPRVQLAAPRRQRLSAHPKTLQFAQNPSPQARRLREHARARVLPGNRRSFTCP